MSAKGIRCQLAELGTGIERLDAVLHAIDREIGAATPETLSAARHVVETLLCGVDELVADLRTLPVLLGEHADEEFAVQREALAATGEKFEGATHVPGEDYLPIRGCPDDLIREVNELFESMFPGQMSEHFTTLLNGAMYRDWPEMELAMKAIQRHRLGGGINSDDEAVEAADDWETDLRGLRPDQITAVQALVRSLQETVADEGVPA